MEPDEAHWLDGSRPGAAEQLAEVLELVLRSWSQVWHIGEAALWLTILATATPHSVTFVMSVPLPRFAPVIITAYPPPYVPLFTRISTTSYGADAAMSRNALFSNVST